MAVFLLLASQAHAAQTSFLCVLDNVASGKHERYDVILSVDGDAWSYAERDHDIVFRDGVDVTEDKILLSYRHPQDSFVAFTYAIDRYSFAIEQFETHHRTKVSVRSSGNCQPIPFRPLKKT